MKKAKNSLYSYYIQHFIICPYCKKNIEVGGMDDQELCPICNKDIDVSQVYFKDD